MAIPPIKVEEQKQAFEYYWALGLTGTIGINQRVVRTAERFKRDRATVYKWKKENNWDLMEQIKNDMIDAAREQLSPESVAILQSDLLLILDQIVKEYLGYVLGEDGKPIKIRNPLDLKRVIEAKNALTGGPPKKETKDVNHKGTIAVLVGDKDLLQDLMEIKENDAEPLPVNDGVETVEGQRMEEADRGGSGSPETDTESS